jgi:uncharacterized protein YjlB
MDLHRPMEPERHEFEPRALETYVLDPEVDIPNSALPLLIYRGVLPPYLQAAGACQSLFKRNRWAGNWVNGVFDYWHFHVTGHEALGCVAGRATVGFGGEHGLAADIGAGDVVVIPAGVGHKRVGASPDFQVVGGYPPGQSGAITRAGDVELEAAREAIAKLALPATDPVFGWQGPLLDHWGADARRGR